MHKVKFNIKSQIAIHEGGVREWIEIRTVSEWVSEWEECRRRVRELKRVNQVKCREIENTKEDRHIHLYALLSHKNNFSLQLFLYSICTSKWKSPIHVVKHTLKFYSVNISNLKWKFVSQEKINTIILRKRKELKKKSFPVFIFSEGKSSFYSACTN